MTPSLVLIKSRPPQPQPKPSDSLKVQTTQKPPTALPFLEENPSSEDEETPVLEDAQIDGAQSQPLQDLPSQVINSPEKRTQDTRSQTPVLHKREEVAGDTFYTLADTGDVRTHKATTERTSNENIAPALVDIGVHGESDSLAIDQPVVSKKTRLTEDIKLLLDRRKGAPLHPEIPVQGRRRRDKKLGRAPSNMSNPSAPVSFLHTKSIEIADSAASASPLDLVCPLPSQQLGYETVDAREHRARMTKRMGTNFNDGESGVRVESIGVVKDLDADSRGGGVGGRVRGRHRNTKA